MEFYTANRSTPARWALTSCIVVLLLMVLVELTLERYFREVHTQDLKLQVTQQLNTLSAELGGVINNNLSLINGLAAHIGISPDIQQREFEIYARAIFKLEPLLNNVAAAPDLVVTMVYPLEPNRKAIGLDYTTNAEQWAAVKSLNRPGQSLLAGPVELVQGGEAVIGRAAVFTGDGLFWGIVSAPMYTVDLYREAGLLEPNQTLAIAIRGRNGLGENGDVFWGNPALFSDSRSVLSSLTVGNGSWQLAAQPINGWSANPGVILVLRGAFSLVCVLLLIMVLHRYYQIKREQGYEKALTKNEALLHEVGKIALVGGWQIVSVNSALMLSYWNEQTSHIFGLENKPGTPSLDTVLSVFPSEQAERLHSAIHNATFGSPFDIELSISTGDSLKRWVRLIGKPMPEGKQPFAVMGSVQDITERKRFTDKIQQQAIYDQLTGLPNRLLFHNRLAKAIERSAREKKQLGVLFIDLDNFKPVNDNLGHSAGDSLLREVGRRIKLCLRVSDTVARYSGDEFIVIVHDLSSPKTAIAIAEHIISSLNDPYQIAARQVFCSASIGISIFPDDGSNADTLVSNADQAMYEVKRSGRNGWQFFTKTLQVVSEKRHQLSTKLVTAISNNEFRVCYQPIVDLTENKVRKCEALVRWYNDDVMIPTDEFIALAEETGRINEIDRFVLATATEFLTGLQQTYNYKVSLSVNVSPRVFSSKDNSLDRWVELVTRAARFLDITVEITERLLIDESDRMMWVLTKLKALGVTIAIDDFGTGYSSLSYLTRFPIDIVKIDQSFIKKLGQERAPEALTETMIDLSHKLSLEVIAEGIETEEQLNFLKRWHCDYGQGYFFDRPLEPEQFTRLIAQASKKGKLSL